MTSTALSAHDVAEFLQNNPDFVAEHSAVFANLKLPHPHERKVISLAERQILALRARTRDLENRLGGLMFNASGNEQILNKLTAWCTVLLAEPQAEKLPGLVTDVLRTGFDIPYVELQLWQTPLSSDHTPQAGVSPEPVEDTDRTANNTALRDYTEALARPYCGPALNQACAALLPQSAQSLAALALRAPTARATLGILVLGSNDPERFTHDMDTTFLDTLGHLAGAALTRLYQASAAHTVS